LKAFLITLLLGFVFLLAESNSIERKIYTHILYSLYPQQTAIKVWSDDANKLKLLQNIPRIKVVQNPKEADIIVLQKSKNVPGDALLFVTDYHLLEHYKKRAIGGFYWQKGRPNILFLKPNLLKHNIQLPKDMQEYIEDTI